MCSYAVYPTITTSVEGASSDTTSDEGEEGGDGEEVVLSDNSRVARAWSKRRSWRLGCPTIMEPQKNWLYDLNMPVDDEAHTGQKTYVCVRLQSNTHTRTRTCK